MSDEMKIEFGSKVLFSIFILLLAAVAYFFVVPALLPRVAAFDAGIVTQQDQSSPVSQGLQEELNRTSIDQKISNKPKVGGSIGEEAPDFTAVNVDGGEVRLSDFRGEKAVLLYFFATWCPYCHEDFENVKEVYPKYSDSVVLLNVDADYGETVRQVKEYKDSNRFVGIFTTTPDHQVLIDYSVLATTTKYAIDRNGRIVWKGSGSASSDIWDRIFKGLEASP